MGATLSRIGRVQSPADLCLIGDGASSWTGTEWASTARYYDIGSPATPLACFIRHNGSMNFVMMDGHALRQTQGQVQAILDAEGGCGKFFDWCARYQGY